MKRWDWTRRLSLVLLGTVSVLGASDPWGGSSLAVADSGKHRPRRATRSSPIAVTSDDQFVWSVNPDNNSVSVFDVAGDANKKIAEIPVGKEPWCVAITPDDQKVYVTNMASGTVSVIDAYRRKVIDRIEVGTEPFGCAVTPDGDRLYVANQSSGTVSVISTRGDRVLETIGDVGQKPHAVAITADGKRVYVTQFLALKSAADPRPLTQSEGADDGREGRVTVINARNNHVIGAVRLAPIADVGPAFRSDGNTLRREPTQATPVFDNVSGAFPNLLESIVVRGDLAYVPGTCSSRNSTVMPC